MKKQIALALFALLTKVFSLNAQDYKPKLEPCNCQFKADSSLKTICGYLLVPENRHNKHSKIIKLPYIIAESNNPNKKKDPLLFTTGGPGGSSIESVSSIHYFSLIKDRDFIAFEQRGTKYALPCLECSEITEAIKTAYLNNLPKEQLINEATIKCRNRLIKSGIDIAGYNTEESTDDINDLINTLKLDSVNLIGMSYSGGLMPNVLRKYPQKIRSLVLDSPLPLSINIDEDELANFNEALHLIFEPIRKESNLDLEKDWATYLGSIANRVFTTEIVDEKSQKKTTLHYSRNDLIGIIGNKIGNEDDRKNLPIIIKDLITNKHKPYIDEYLISILNNNNAFSGMRLSVYCSDKIAYADMKIAQNQYDLYPYMSGLWANDVSPAMCKCWNIPAIKADSKKPFYSNIPMLLSAGLYDPACRPLYNDILHHYFPQSQRLLFTKGAHCPLISLEGEQYISQFLNNPFKKIISNTEGVKAF
jgi:pimeloyl-ACP methyl ester carboxylesterase